MKKLKLITLKIMIIVIAFTAFGVPLSYAIYKNVTKTNISGDLASWNITVDDSGSSNHLSIIPDPNGTTSDYTINITNESEVDITYSIVIDGLPSGVSVSIDDREYNLESNNKVIIPNAGILAYSPSGSSAHHKLTFKAASTTSIISDKEVDINVIAKQKL